MLEGDISYLTIQMTNATLKFADISQGQGRVPSWYDTFITINIPFKKLDFHIYFCLFGPITVFLMWAFTCFVAASVITVNEETYSTDKHKYRLMEKEVSLFLQNAGV